MSYTGGVTSEMGSGNPFGIHRAPNADALAERRYKALELRAKGARITDIVVALNVSGATVRKDIDWALAQRLADNHARGRQVEVEKLEQLNAAAWRVLDDAGADWDRRLKAMDRLVRISERRAKLEGYDSPVRVDATVHEVTQQDLELQQLLREAQAHTSAAHQAVRAPAEPEAPDGGVA